jgi:BlaI family transcriptional regulator, penicillinase repressor
MPDPRPPGRPKPTDAELAILRVLWRRGPSTVRDIYEDAEGSLRGGYTTILKLLQIMTDKGLVLRNADRRTHVYRAAVGEDQTQRQLVRHLLDRAFGGSTRKLVLQALSAKKASRAELREIRELLEQFEEGGAPGFDGGAGEKKGGRT